MNVHIVKTVQKIFLIMYARTVEVDFHHALFGPELNVDREYAWLNNLHLLTVSIRNTVPRKSSNLQHPLKIYTQRIARHGRWVMVSASIDPATHQVGQTGMGLCHG